MLQNEYAYGTPDYMPFLPGCMSGVCLGARVNLAMAVLTFFQPTSPNRPIVQTKGSQPPKQTLANARGDVWPYGDLKHLPAFDDDTSAAPNETTMAKTVNSAISSAGFLTNCWDKIQAAGVVVRMLLMLLPAAAGYSSCVFKNCTSYMGQLLHRPSTAQHCTDPALPDPALPDQYAAAYHHNRICTNLEHQLRLQPEGSVCLLGTHHSVYLVHITPSH
jgi:hypothetical protein